MRSTKKKAAAAAVLVSALAFTACSSNTTPAETPGTGEGGSTEKTTITWMQWWANEQGWEKLEAVEAAFEAAHPEIDLQIEDVPAGQAHDKLTTLALAGQAPDVMSMQSAWLTEFAKAGIITPIEDYLAGSDLLDQISPSLLPEYLGHVWATPSSLTTVGMFYNQDLLDEAGVAVPTTWEEYRAAAQAVTEKTGKFGTTANLGTEPPAPISYEIIPFIASAGGQMLDAGGDAVFASPEGVSAIEFVKSVWVEDGSGTPGIAAANEPDKRENFAAGNTAFMFDGPAGINIVKGTNPDLNYGVAPMPKGKTTGSMALGSVLGISAESENKDAAFAFISWLSGPEGGKIWAEQLGFFPPNLEAQKAAVISDNDKLAVFAGIAADTDNLLAIDQTLPNNLELRRTFTESLQAFFAGDIDAMTALQQSQDRWNEVIAEAKG